MLCTLFSPLAPDQVHCSLWAGRGFSWLPGLPCMCNGVQNKILLYDGQMN